MKDYRNYLYLFLAFVVIITTYRSMYHLTTALESFAFGLAFLAILWAAYTQKRAIDGLSEANDQFVTIIADMHEERIQDAEAAYVIRSEIDYEAAVDYEAEQEVMKRNFSGYSYPNWKGGV